MIDAIGDALKTAMMHSDAPMVLCDPHLSDCPMVAVNPAFVAITGYTEEESIGRNCRFLQGPMTDKTTVRRIRSCLEAGQGCIEWIVNYRKDGSSLWNVLFLSPVNDAAGNLRYFFGNQLDITQGYPEWLVDTRFGRAHVATELEKEFHKLLHEVGVAARAQILDQIVSAAHRLAEITTQLKPGTLDRSQSISV